MKMKNVTLAGLFYGLFFLHPDIEIHSTTPSPKIHNNTDAESLAFRFWFVNEPLFLGKTSTSVESILKIRPAQKSLYSYLSPYGPV